MKPKLKKIHESMNSQRRRTNKRNKELQGNNITFINNYCNKIIF